MSQADLLAESDNPVPLAEPVPDKSRPVMSRVAAGVAIVVLLGFIAFAGPILWQEWTLLQREAGSVRRTEIVGYLDIFPTTTYAVSPPDWFRADGGQSLLWSHWENGVGHHWFRFASGDIDKARLCRPRTPFVSRPIDYPLVETEGGEIWRRIPTDSTVVGHQIRGVNCVYPITVLGKVQAINDVVDDHPYLIAMNLFAPAAESVAIFDAEHDGHRLTLAATGYFQDSKPLLCDRGTESLWIEQAEGLKAIAGKHRGVQLAKLAQPTPVSWKDWLAHNRRSRLLVGADRSRGIPAE